jgi:hypothetical protein
MGNKGDFHSWLKEAREATIIYNDKNGAEKAKTGKPEEILEILNKVGWKNIVMITRVV